MQKRAETEFAGFGCEWVILGFSAEVWSVRDEFKRCRFYPRCEIHLGWPLPDQPRHMSSVDLGERLEINAQVRSGRTTGDVAREHGLDYRQVYRVIKRLKRFI